MKATGFGRARESILQNFASQSDQNYATTSTRATNEALKNATLKARKDRHRAISS